VKCLGNPLATFDGRRIDAALHKADKFNRIAAFLREFLLRQLFASTQRCDLPAQLLLWHAVKLWACDKSLNVVKLRFFEIEIFMPFVKLETPNSQYLSIAQSWFNLCDYSKAKEALDRIVPDLQQHPEVLRLRADLKKNQSQYLQN
jgi:hypothetical protein